MLKNTKRIFRPFTIFQLPKIEKWLKEQAKSGLKLIAYNRGVFTFSECEPKEREYYICSEFPYEKYDTFYNEFFKIERLYSLRKSTLNRANKVRIPSTTILEIDVRKIDADYEKSRALRTQHYTKQFKKCFIVFTIPSIIMFITALFAKETWPLAVLYLCIVIYFFLSFIKMKKQIKLYQQEKNDKND